MGKATWTDSGLWHQIENITNERDPWRLLLNVQMPIIEQILAQASTAPKDFTLHDEGHGYRVAEWMVQITPGDVLERLSVAELSLLLLSAYLHDIGMSPEWGKIEAHLRYLVEGSVDALQKEDVERFQLWLLEREGVAFSAPISNQGKIQELLTYYCRARHNDWSSEWIQAHFAKEGPYQGWRDDLILICASHHLGYDALARPTFNPRQIQAGNIVHRRYLAAVLRIADILENDPERTPDVLLRHRAINVMSELHWQKNLVMHQRLTDGRLLITAEPASALMHRAIEETADAIDHELAVCDRLSREAQFGYDPATGESLPHRWALAAGSIRSIRPKPNSYEYIAGAFRPNTSRLLQLLSGPRLYESRLSAVRELVQNAFDAIREQIAREQMAANRPDPAYADIVAARHCVHLQFHAATMPLRLTCSDTGVGMSKRIITDRFLVSGTGMDADLLDLQMRCHQLGIAFDRSGQFGIGVLSYFMLADHVTLRSRRSLETGTPETNGWEFETWGVGSFGELRPKGQANRGTEVVLDLRPSALKDLDGDDKPRAFYEQLRGYLTQHLIRIPCKFALTTDLPGLNRLEIDRGWTQSPQSRIQSEITSLTSQERKRIESALRWITTEGELPQRLGRFRISRAWFQTEWGPCLGFPLIDGRGVARKSGNIYVPGGAQIVSWYGSKIEARSSLPGAHGAMVEIDWRSPQAGNPDVSRRVAQLNQPMSEVAGEHIRRKLSRAYGAISKQAKTGPLNWINAALNQSTPPRSVGPSWFVVDSDRRLKLTQVPFPATTDHVLDAVPKGYDVAFEGQPIAVCASLVDGLKSSGGFRSQWPSSNCWPPDRFVPTSKLDFCPIWDGTTTRARPEFRCVVLLPKEWDDVLVIDTHKVEEDALINGNNPLIKALISEAPADVRGAGNPDREMEFDALKDALTPAARDARAARRWLFEAIVGNRYAVWEVWPDLARKRQQDLLRVWSKAFEGLPPHSSVLRIHDSFDEEKRFIHLEEISPKGLKTFRVGTAAATRHFRQRLAQPGQTLSLLKRRLGNSKLK